MVIKDQDNMQSKSKIKGPNLGPPVKIGQPKIRILFPNARTKSFSREISEKNSSFANSENPPILDKPPSYKLEISKIRENLISGVRIPKKDAVDQLTMIQKALQDLTHVDINKHQKLKAGVSDKNELSIDFVDVIRQSISNLSENEEGLSENFLLCEICFETNKIPMHCNRLMFLKEDSFKCLECEEITEFPKHCSNDMIIQADDDNNLLIINRSKDLIKRGYYQDALDLMKSNLAKANDNKQDSKFLVGQFYLQLSIVFHLTNNLEDAKYWASEAKSIFIELNDKGDVKMSNLILASIIFDQGEINEAEELILNNLEEDALSKDAVNIHEYLMVGRIKRIRGKYDESMTNFVSSLLIAEKLDNKLLKAESLYQIAALEKEIGEYESSLKNYLRAKEIYEMTENFNLQANLHFFIALLGIEIENYELVNSNLSVLSDLIKRNPNNKEINFRYQLIQALVLKDKPRMVDKTEAFTILKELLEETQAKNFETKIFLMLHLCKMLIIELEAFEEREVLEEARNLSDKLVRFSEQQNLKSLYIQTSVLQAKLSLIDGDLDKANSHLANLKTFAISNEMDSEIPQIERMVTELQTQMNKWVDLVDQNTSFKERIRESDIQMYIKTAIAITNLESQKI